MPDEGIGLPPTSVVPLRVLFDITGGEVGERAGAARGLTFGDGVTARDDAEHSLCRQLARIGERDGVDVAEMEPARPPVA